MQKLVLILLVVSLLLTGCNTDKAVESDATKETTLKITATPTLKPTPTASPSPTPTPISLQIKYKQVAIEDGLITMDIPDTLEIVENYTGSLFFAYGLVQDEKGNDVYYNISVTSFFQKEEPALTYEIMDEYMDVALVFPHGKDINVTRVGDVELSESTKGYRAKCELFDGSVFNYINLQGDDRYYKIDIYTEKDFMKEDDIQRIFDSVIIDPAIEKESVNNFEVKTEKGRYYSSKMEDVSIKLPEEWNPTESTVFSYDNHVLGMTSFDNLSFIHVTVYDKKISNMQDFNTFFAIMATEVANRGHVSFDDISKVTYYLDDAGRRYYVYPNDNSFIVQCLLEFEDMYYCVQGYYMGKHQSGADEILNIITTFNAPGTEIFQE